MKIIRLILPAIMMFCACAVKAQHLYVASYNIRYENKNDTRKGNGWTQRCRPICAQINFEHPDIFGAQEVKHNQLNDMLTMLDGYEFIGSGRDDGKQAGEYSPIFYDPQKLQLLEHGQFWIAENPDKPGIGWDAACPRICTWGRFLTKGSDKEFLFLNLHLDHKGKTARTEGAKLIIQKIKELSSESLPVILTGDFNGSQHDTTYQLFSQSGMLIDTYANSRIRFAENGTFNNYKQNEKNDSRIDHIFVSRHFGIERYAILTNSYWASKKPGRKPQRRLPSDHYPVFVHLIFK